MKLADFTETELRAAVARGVRQLVVIGSRAPFEEAAPANLPSTMRVFAVDGVSEALAEVLEKSNFDKLKSSLFVWIGGAGYRTVDAVMANLSFIASLPKGSGVLLDYVVERTSLGSRTQTALDAFASRLLVAGNSVKYLVQSQAVTAMLRGLGFRQIVDLTENERQASGGHLVSATV
jgi:O-methyltransferase involved in polyketide biosynthesis